MNRNINRSRAQTYILYTCTHLFFTFLRAMNVYSIHIYLCKNGNKRYIIHRCHLGYKCNNNAGKKREALIELAFLHHYCTTLSISFGGHGIALPKNIPELVRKSL